VVVTVEAERLAELGVGEVVVVWAGLGAIMRAGCAVAAGSAAQGAALVFAAGVDGPKEGAVRVRNTAGWVATVSGTPLPPVSPARMSWWVS
jgi:hypothetical protein